MTRPMRVHLVHQGFHDYVEGLIGGIQTLEDPGIDLTVTTITSGPPTPARLRVAPEAYRAVTVPRFREPRSIFAANRAVGRILDGSWDLVHWQAAGNPWVDLAFWRWLRRSDRPPAAVTVHDMQAHPGDRNVLPGTFRVIRKMVRRAEQVIVHAPHIRGQAVAAGAPAERVSVLPHGELGTCYAPAEHLPLAPTGEPTVLFFGRAQGYKGLDVAIAAMDLVADRVPGAKLIVAGAGPSLEDMLPADSPVPPWCELHRGRVPDAEVTELFRRSAVVALPYREASQSGVAALAAGFGRPVVASRLPGLIDIVAEGQTGLLVEPGSASSLADALVGLLSDQAEVQRLGDGAFALARADLAWPRIANRLHRLYHGAVLSRTAGSRDAVGEAAP